MKNRKGRLQHLGTERRKVHGKTDHLRSEKEENTRPESGGIEGGGNKWGKERERNGRVERRTQWMGMRCHKGEKTWKRISQRR